MRLCLLLAIFSIAAARLTAAAGVDSLPKPTGYVSDLAHVVNPADKEELEAFCTKVEQQLGVQMALVTIDTIGDEPIENFTIDLARKWGVGKKDDQGVLLLLAVKDRKSRVETGRGLEPYITDGFAGSTLRSMRPQLRAGSYGPALLAGARQMAAQIAQGKGIAFADAGPVAQEPREDAPEQSSGRGIPISLIVIGVLFLLLFLGRRGGGGGGGFLIGMLLGNLLGGDRRGGNWGGGGGFGGNSGGSGGFGGFGGGGFGGGGASSNW
jgi:uncharacterized protein